MPIKPFDLMNLISWVSFGAMVGLIIDLVDNRKAPGGIFGAVAIGAMGAVVGGYISGLLLGFNLTGFNFEPLLIATVFGIVSLIIYRFNISIRR